MSYENASDCSLLVLGFVLGVVVTLAVQSYVAWRYLFCDTSVSSIKNEEEVVVDHHGLNVAHEKSAASTVGAASFQLPRELSKLITNRLDGRRPRAATASGSTLDSNSCLVNNLIIQFLFRELRDTVRVHRWFMQKLNVEFEELLQRTTVGKLFEKITVRDLHLGHQFPFFKSLSVGNLRLHEAGHIEELDVLIDLDYEGGFQLAVDADLVLQRSAFLAVRVDQMSGRSRLRFSRSPYTHWSFAFCVEPHLDVHVESHFQGRPLPHFTSLIVNQIRRLVRKKHTLPNYKVRYRPFFHKPECGVDDVDVYLLNKNRITEGLLHVTVVECSRLLAEEDVVTTGGETRVYCTLAIDSSAWVDYVPSKNSTWVTRDVGVVRQPGQAVGVTFKQEFVFDKYEHCVVVDSVTANSPAAVAGVRSGDILIAVNGSKVNSASHAARLCKANTETKQLAVGGKLTFRIDREDGDDKIASGAKGDANQAGVVEASSPQRSSSFDSAAGKSPVSETLPGETSLTGKRHLGLESRGTVRVEDTNGGVTLRRTSALKFVRDPVFRETFTFNVENRHRFLILCVWRRVEDQKVNQDKCGSSPTSGGLGVSGSPSMRAVDKADVLVGRVSVSLLDVAMECAANSSGMHRHTFQLMPPEPKATAHSRSNKPTVHQGFDENLCYGDVTLSFIHKPGAPNIKADDKTNVEMRKDEEELEPAGVVPAESDVEEDTFSVLNDSTASSELERLDHDFIITQFNSTISCHFCGKKIWFKIAFKCRCCALVCHKKCVAKCRDATTCCRDGVRLKQSAAAVPRIIKTDSSPSDATGSDVGDDVDRDVSVLESPKTQRRLRSLLSTMVSASYSDGSVVDSSSAAAATAARRSSTPLNTTMSIPRIGSNNRLPPPSVGCEEHCSSAGAQSKSLPPSPQTTSPTTSRKASLQTGLLEVGDGDDLETSDDIATTIERLLQYANDETIVSVAKEKGRELFAGEALEKRKSKLDLMVSRLQVEIDQETERRNLLATIERESMGLRGVRGLRARHERTRLALLLTKSDEKIQALSILMLFYCSGLQHCFEVEGSSSSTATGTAEDESDSSAKDLTEVSPDVPPI